MGNHLPTLVHHVTSQKSKCLSYSVYMNQIQSPWRWRQHISPYCQNRRITLYSVKNPKDNDLTNCATCSTRSLKIVFLVRSGVTSGIAFQWTDITCLYVMVVEINRIIFITHSQSKFATAVALLTSICEVPAWNFGLETGIYFLWSVSFTALICQKCASCHTTDILSLYFQFITDWSFHHITVYKYKMSFCWCNELNRKVYKNK